MGDFEFLFALFGILFGLIVAEVSLKFADAVESRRVRPLGILTPALAFLILTDLTNFSLFLWGSRAGMVVSWRLVFTGVLLAMVYLLAAAQTFPRGNSACPHLDEHYWSRKRIVAGGVLFVNIVVTGALLTRAIPAWDDWWFYFYFPSYMAAIAGLVLSRSRRLDLFFLGWALLVNLSAGSDLVPHSEFGRTTGIVPSNE
jgi:hypothetical protein